MSHQRPPVSVSPPPQMRQRTYKTMFNGQSAWVKMAEDKSFPLTPLFQRAVETPFMPPALRCTFIFDRVEALKFEAERLRHLHARGHNVPDILEQGPKHLVLSDTGISMWSLLKSSAGAKAILADVMGIALAGLHNEGDYHGQPYPKNITHNGGTVSFIDLEDDALKVMSLEDAQLRDVWLMAHGCWPFAGQQPTIGARVVNAYASSVDPTIRRGLQTRLSRFGGQYARVVHAATGANMRENLRRYAWTYRSVEQGLKRRITI